MIWSYEENGKIPYSMLLLFAVIISTYISGADILLHYTYRCFMIGSGFLFKMSAETFY